MRTAVTVIGRCKGCDKTSKLDDGVCSQCLTNPRKMTYPGSVKVKGRKLTGARAWAEVAHKIRTDSNMHLLAYQQIKHPMAQTIFIAEFGFPEGASVNDELIAFIQTRPAIMKYPKIQAFIDSKIENPRSILKLVK